MTHGNVRYPAVLVALHWGMAVLLVLQFMEGYIGRDVLPKPLWFNVHWYMGAALLTLEIVRLVMRGRLAGQVPEKPLALSRPEWTAAKIGHFALYALLLAAPLSGLAKWWFRIEVLGEIHETIVTAFWILIALHVLAVIKHRIMDKTDLLARMRF